MNRFWGLGSGVPEDQRQRQKCTQLREAKQSDTHEQRDKQANKQTDTEARRGGAVYHFFPLMPQLVSVDHSFSPAASVPDPVAALLAGSLFICIAVLLYIFVSVS